MKIRLVVTLSSLLYKIIGGRLSNNLNDSWIGRKMYRIISGSQKQFKIYSTIEGIKVKLTDEEARSFGIVYLGTINKNETDVLKKIIKLGDIVIDIGAYADGWYTLLTSRLVGKNGCVYAFEPHPIYYQRFKENVLLNRLTNTTLEQCGISDKQGRFTFYEARLASSLIKSQAMVHTKGAPKEMTIQTTTLDAYIEAKNIRHVSFVKIDVEGAGMSVLNGANRLLRSSNAPDLLVEVFDEQLRRGGSSERKLLSYLKRFGYTPYILTANGLALYKGKQNPTLNLFFSKQSH